MDINRFDIEPCFAPHEFRQRTNRAIIEIDGRPHVRVTAHFIDRRGQKDVLEETFSLEDADV